MAAYVEDVQNGTHIVAPSKQLKRTVKLLSGISSCLHILDEKWLDVSAENGFAANEKEYCLNDIAKEKQWNFELKQTMYGHTLEDRKRLLHDYTFYITPHKSVRPTPKELMQIIQCAGGKVIIIYNSFIFILTNMHFHSY